MIKALFRYIFGKDRHTKMTVYKLEMMGKTCIYDELDDITEEVWIALDEGGVEEIKITRAEMTEEHYESLKDFEGW